jgi:hypothetical protein
VGDERAETYLRLRAEAEVRRLLRLPGGVPDPRWVLLPPTRPGVHVSIVDIARSVQQVRWAGEILVAAGLLADESVTRIAAELDVALMLRSRTEPAWFTRRLGWVLEQLGSAPGEQAPPDHRAAQPMRMTPIGRVLGVANDRAPSDLHLMTLVRAQDGAELAVAMRMRWPLDGSSADLEITGAGPQHLPYDQLWAVDDRGADYRLGLAGEGRTVTWQGTIQLSPAPPPGARWLDLIADGTHRLIRLDLDAPAPPARVTIERSPAVPAGERLLGAQAERILASAWDIEGPDADQRLGEMITVLAAAGAIAADSATPGHLAALCQRLGAEENGITAPAAAEIPGPWASILAQRDAEPPGHPGELFAPLAVVLPDIEGARFALAGLTSAAGESHLHVVASGMPELPAPGRDTGFSWWIRDGAGNWHVAVETDPPARPAGQTAFRLRLTPPLDASPDTIEVVVTGPVTRVRAVVPVRGDRGMRDAHRNIRHLGHEP